MADGFNAFELVKSVMNYTLSRRRNCTQARVAEPVNQQKPFLGGEQCFKH